MADDAKTPRDLARDAREKARARLAAELPGEKRPPVAHDPAPSPCGGWYAAAALCYQMANTASDINGAIELYLQGDDYTLIGDACMETLDTL